MIFRETESFRDYPVKQKCAGFPAHFFCPAGFLCQRSRRGCCRGSADRRQGRQAVITCTLSAHALFFPEYVKNNRSCGIMTIPDNCYTLLKESHGLLQRIQAETPDAGGSQSPQSAGTSSLMSRSGGICALAPSERWSPIPNGSISVITAGIVLPMKEN